MIQLEVMRYTTFEDERKPTIGIYYLFKDRFRGLYRVFKLDVEEYIASREIVVERSYLYDFKNESKLIKNLKKKKIQGIQTNLGEGVSFSHQAVVISQMHFDLFLKRHDWL